ncbi:MAG TPA: DNA-3-methyladenine glycosylase [Egibacteraceae bacterium]|nr:DNA-3-methyladenine glycosylase [Egibacteraceae bacterium]
MTPLERGFFARHAPAVARDLVGKLLIRADDGLVVRIVEAEAYTEDDPACHAHRGQTARNAPLFGPAGHAYVYFTYGMHWCLNTATGGVGDGQGCLLRAAEPLEGLAVMRRRRSGAADAVLLRGPARLAQAFGLDGSWTGIDLCDGGLLRLADDGARPGVEVTPRVGVSTAADVPWRFAARSSPWVSPYRRSARAPAPAPDACSAHPPG